MPGGDGCWVGAIACRCQQCSASPAQPYDSNSPNKELLQRRTECCRRITAEVKQIAASPCCSTHLAALLSVCCLQGWVSAGHGGFFGCICPGIPKGFLGQKQPWFSASCGYHSH